ncbi:hypothetical protein HGRIS_004174 [Hohenbuehelia grisea]|uniref:Uncharacterized protein n=1 Tax=Hohenbuehelia grisea TaxID=104357 RepID=A0ABR3JI34_9AGAR
METATDFTGPPSVLQALNHIVAHFQGHPTLSEPWTLHPLGTSSQPRSASHPTSPESVPDNANQPIQVSYDVKLNRQTSLNILYTYAAGAMVEYPETTGDGRIGHLFRLDPDAWERPDGAFGYSYGNPGGALLRDNPRSCSLLKRMDGSLVPCIEIHRTCQGCKVCPFASTDYTSAPHSKGSRYELLKQLSSQRQGQQSSAERTLFEQTLAYSVALQKHGCLAPENELTEYGQEEGPQREEWLMQVQKGQRGHESKSHCAGRIILQYDSIGSPFVHRGGMRDHFVDFSIACGVYYLLYLVALFQRDHDTIKSIEALAHNSGFGPHHCHLAISNASSVRINCPNEHRDTTTGLLKIAEMKTLPCNSKLRIFEPLEEYRRDCPYVLIICNGEHEHPIPIPTKTPASVRNEIHTLLRSLDQDLPDLTPRRFLRHPTTMAFLANRFPGVQSPMLSDIHPSLANRDHLRAYIQHVQGILYPEGTGWEAEKAKQTAAGIQYI